MTSTRRSETAGEDFLWINRHFVVSREELWRHLFPPLLSGGDEQVDPNPNSRNTSVNSLEKQRENEVELPRWIIDETKADPEHRGAPRAHPAPGLSVPGGLHKGVSLLFHPSSQFRG